MKRWLILAYSIVAAGALTACAAPVPQPQRQQPATTQTATAGSASLPAAAVTTTETAESSGVTPPTSIAPPQSFEKEAVVIPDSQSYPITPTTTAPRSRQTAHIPTATTKRTTTSRPAPRPTSTGSKSSAAAGTTKPAAPSSYEQQVAALTNAERQKAGLKPLTLDATLCQNAAVRAREIVQTFDHTRPDGSAFQSVITIPWRTVGENIAYGQRSPQEVVGAWMDSSGHRANMLKPAFTKIGVGVYESGGRLYWVQLFAG